MGMYVNVGNAGFQSILKTQYIDKTGMIDFINHTLGTKQKLTCFSRPRRFGKSFAAQMLCAYYDKSCNSRELFQNLTIGSLASFEQHLNKYDVIYLDITGFISQAGKKENIANIVQKIQSEVMEELERVYPDMLGQENLAKMLYRIASSTGHKFIVIIDEWDALFRECPENKDIQEEYIQFLRSLFKNSAMTDAMIEGAYLTGILPIKKYGTQSAMTDFREFTMLRPGPLKQYVGFTEEETKRLFENSALDFDEVKKWYDGYMFGDMHIYNPKSVMDALMFEEFGNYWTQSETYEALKVYIDMNMDGLKECIVDMLSGNSCEINCTSFQNDMTTIQNKDDVLTLLVHLGYLVYHSKTQTVSIPNEEIREEFINAVSNGNRRELMNVIKASDQLLKDTYAMDEAAVAEAVQSAHEVSTAPLFYNNEQSLRSVIRFAYISAIDEYQEIQELPTGKGYADIVYIPKKHSSKPAMIIELKWNHTAEGAIDQVKKGNYPQVIHGLATQVLLVGINYDSKTKVHTCKIEAVNMRM